MKDKLLEIYHYRRQQYLNREDSDLKILQGLLKDLEGVIKDCDRSVEELIKEFGAVEEPKDQTLWYPDNSGEWVEYDGSGQPVEDDVFVAVILKGEREDKYYAPHAMPDYEWSWDWSEFPERSHVVAYKVVKE